MQCFLVTQRFENRAIHIKLYGEFAWKFEIVGKLISETAQYKLTWKYWRVGNCRSTLCNCLLVWTDKKLSSTTDFCLIFFLVSMLVRLGQRHGRLCNIAKVWTLSTLLGDCPTLMDSHLHNLKGGTFVSKKLVGRSIPRLAKKAFHSNGVTLTSEIVSNMLHTRSITVGWLLFWWKLEF